MAGWRIEGQYMETCNCNYICPCVGSNLTARPSEGDCKAAVAMRIDERASKEQAEAISAIATGAAGGPMAALGPLVGRLAGVERRPIRFEQDGMSFSVRAGELIDQALEGVPGPARPGEPIYLDNTCHPVSSKLALARARRSKFNAFGIRWDDASGLRNGHFARFAWSA